MIWLHVTGGRLKSVVTTGMRIRLYWYINEGSCTLRMLLMFFKDGVSIFVYSEFKKYSHFDYFAALLDPPCSRTAYKELLFHSV